ncbi:hypothetical protein Tco_0458708 [Tanacetum coccineum]
MRNIKWSFSTLCLGDLVQVHVLQMIDRTKVSTERDDDDHNQDMVFDALTIAIGRMPSYSQERDINEIIGELRAISGHVLRATGIQIPEDDLDNLHAFKEVDGILIFILPRFPIRSFLVLPEGCDPLALVESLTPVECNTCLLETMFEVEAGFVFSVDGSDSVNLTFLSFFLGMTLN